MSTKRKYTFMKNVWNFYDAMPTSLYYYNLYWSSIAAFTTFLCILKKLKMDYGRSKLDVWGLKMIKKYPSDVDQNMNMTQEG